MQHVEVLLTLGKVLETGLQKEALRRRRSSDRRRTDRSSETEGVFGMLGGPRETALLTRRAVRILRSLRKPLQKLAGLPPGAAQQYLQKLSSAQTGTKTAVSARSGLQRALRRLQAGSGGPQRALRFIRNHIL